MMKITLLVILGAIATTTTSVEAVNVRYAQIPTSFEDVEDVAVASAPATDSGRGNLRGDAQSKNARLGNFLKLAKEQKEKYEAGERGMMVDDAGMTTTTQAPLPSLPEVMKGDDGVRVMENTVSALPQVAMTEGRFEQLEQERKVLREKAEAEAEAEAAGTLEYITGDVEEGRSDSMKSSA